MAKAPAFQFYYDRFNSSTSLWDDAQVGKYVRLMICQANKGFVSEKELTKVAAGDEDVLSKFVKISDGKFANEVLSEILAARDKYSENRANNRKSGHYKKKEESYENHMKIIDSSQKNHMVDVDVVVGKEKKEKKISTKVGEEIFIPADHLPDGWDRDKFMELWSEFEKMRIKAKKPLSTNLAIKGCFNDLIKFSGESYQLAEEIVLMALKRNWLTFYEVKPNGSSHQSSQVNGKRVRDKF